MKSISSPSISLAARMRRGGPVSLPPRQQRPRGTPLLAQLSQPHNMLVTVWVLHVILFFVGPTEYTREPALATWLWIAAGIAAVLCGHGIAARARILPPRPPVPAARVGNVVFWTGLIGIAGILLLATDKILFSGLDYSTNMATLRFQRDAQVNLGVDVERSPLLFLGYPTFSFAYAALLLFVLDAERLKGRAALVGQLAILSPVIYAFLYGSRGNLLLLSYLLAGALIARRMTGRPAMPAIHGLRWKLGLFVAGFLAYSNFTWQDRRTYSAMDLYDRFGTLTASWGMRPRAWVDDLVAGGWISGETAMNLLSYTHYYVHSFVSVDRIREFSSELTPFGGFFQIGILSPITRIVAPDWGHLADMQQQLRGADLLGFYVTVLGAAFLDFGLIGAAVVLILWGFLCSLCYRSAVESGSLGAQLFLCAVVCSIFISPMNSPIGMSNSFLILAGFAVAARGLRAPRLEARKPDGLSGNRLAIPRRASRGSIAA